MDVAESGELRGLDTENRHPTLPDSGTSAETAGRGGGYRDSEPRGGRPARRRSSAEDSGTTAAGSLVSHLDRRLYRQGSWPPHGPAAVDGPGSPLPGPAAAKANHGEMAMNDEQQQRIQHAIRAWAARPPALSPRVARARVLARLEERRAWPKWRLAAVAAVLAWVLALGLSWLRPPTLSNPSAGVFVEPPSARFLVYELRSGTKLYLTLDSSKGDH